MNLVTKTSILLAVGMKELVVGSKVTETKFIIPENETK